LLKFVRGLILYSTREPAQFSTNQRGLGSLGFNKSVLSPGEDKYCGKADPSLIWLPLLEVAVLGASAAAGEALGYGIFRLASGPAIVTADISLDLSGLIWRLGYM
jgi:hypothetical protein